MDFEEARARLYTRKRRDGTLEYDWLPMTDGLYDALQRLSQEQQGEWVFPEPETGSRICTDSILCGDSANGPESNLSGFMRSGI